MNETGSESYKGVENHDLSPKGGVTMKARPVKHCKTPAYPTRLEVAADPALLEKHMPEAWKRSARFAATVSMLASAGSLALNPGCASGPPAKVAPVFDHGSGRGALGCVMVVPPAFLSEEEALQIISETLAEHGLTASASTAPLSGVKFKGHRTNPGAVTYRDLYSPATTPLVPDFFDSDKNVAIEFVSTADYFELGGEISDMSVQGYDLKEIAKITAETVNQKGSGVYFGALYDPVAQVKFDEQYPKHDSPDYDAEVEAFQKKGREAVAAAKEESKELLREQVKDFVDWLQGQGAI
jgi:hypothetical protein